MKAGNFVISLDFELMWGVHDQTTIEKYGINIKNVPSVITNLLALFKNYNINATFATVGFLFLKNTTELAGSIPSAQPKYLNKKLSPYNGYIELLARSKSDLYHFAPHIIEEISRHTNHEIGTHTYSHFYCLEKHQTAQEFEEDIKFAIDISVKNNLQTSSIVFPRNQINHDYLPICKKYGIICYRGNPTSWFYRRELDNFLKIFQRSIRFLDRYISITGHHTYNIKSINKSKEIINVPASRFLSPYNGNLKYLEGLRLKRIKDEMSFASKNATTYHLWWHPHNFGQNIEKNLDFLEQIFVHYQYLNNQTGFRSLTMNDAASLI